MDVISYDDLNCSICLCVFVHISLCIQVVSWVPTVGTVLCGFPEYIFGDQLPRTVLHLCVFVHISFTILFMCFRTYLFVYSSYFVGSHRGHCFVRFSGIYIR